MARQPFDLAAMLNFIRTPPPETGAPDLRSLMLPYPGQQGGAERRYKERQASLMAEKADEIYGTPQVGQEQVTSPYQMSQAELMPGEAPIPGLQNELQEQSADFAPATGIYDTSVPVQQRMLGMNQRMLKAGVPGYTDQWSKNQGNMQNANMQQLSMLAGKRFDASNPLTSKIKEYQWSQKDPGFLDYQNQIAKSGAVNLGGTEFTSVTEANNLRYLDGSRVAPFTPKSELVNKVRALSAAEQKDASGARKSVAIVDEMDDMLFGSFGIFKDYKDGQDMEWDDRLQHAWTSNVQQYLQTDPRYKQFVAYADGTLAPFAKSLGQAGSLSDTDLELVQNLVPRLTGVNPDTPAVAGEKLKKMRRLITAGLEDGGKITTSTLYSVIGDQSSGGAPRPGSVVDGFMFLGGDPNDETRWVKQ